MHFYSTSSVVVHTCDYTFIPLDANYIFTAASSHVRLEDIDIDDLHEVSLNVDIRLTTDHTTKEVIVLISIRLWRLVF